jgi:hypothetical protein
LQETIGLSFFNVHGSAYSPQVVSWIPYKKIIFTISLIKKQKAGRSDLVVEIAGMFQILKAHFAGTAGAAGRDMLFFRSSGLSVWIRA